MMNSIHDQQQLRSEPVERGMVAELNRRKSRLEWGLSIVSWQKSKEATAVLRSLGVVVAIAGKGQGLPVMAAVPRASQRLALACFKESGAGSPLSGF